jgi:hypothetical protein
MLEMKISLKKLIQRIVFAEFKLTIFSNRKGPPLQSSTFAKDHAIMKSHEISNNLHNSILVIPQIPILNVEKEL